MRNFKFLLFFLKYVFVWSREIKKQEIVFKKDKATLHVISKKCEDSNYSNKIRRQSDDTSKICR